MAVAGADKDAQAEQADGERPAFSPAAGAIEAQAVAQLGERRFLLPEG